MMNGRIIFVSLALFIFLNPAYLPLDVHSATGVAGWIGIPPLYVGPSWSKGECVRGHALGQEWCVGNNYEYNVSVGDIVTELVI
jgi:hypothetical protein